MERLTGWCPFRAIISSDKALSSMDGFRGRGRNAFESISGVKIHYTSMEIVFNYLEGAGGLYAGSPGGTHQSLHNRYSRST